MRNKIFTVLLCFAFIASNNAQTLKQKSNNIPLALNWSPQTPELQTGIVEKDVTVFGQKIHYQEAGSNNNQVVVLLHGLGGSSVNWVLNIAPLAQKFRVIVPDQVGFGKSDKPFISYRVGTYVDFLDAFLTQLKIEKVSIAGISLGGWIAAQYAITYPKRVEKLVLVDAAGFAPSKDFDPRFFQNLFPTTRTAVRQSLSLIVFNRELFSSDAMIDTLLTQRFSAGDGYTIQQIIESVKRGEDYVDGKLSQIKQQTLIIWGKQDGLITVDNGERFKREIQNSQLIIFDQCGHAPSFEKATEFNAALLKFLTTETRP
jgi:pimeloyl-ACP methyl ester carboxylesterase